MCSSHSGGNGCSEHILGPSLGWAGEPTGASLARGPGASGKPGEPRGEPAGEGVWGRNVGDNREGRARKEFRRMSVTRSPFPPYPWMPRGARHLSQPPSAYQT